MVLDKECEGKMCKGNGWRVKKRRKGMWVMRVKMMARGMKEKKRDGMCRI